ncbi:MAG: peptidoglycan editing factor PgeF [Thermomicrobiales bacterium]
MSSNGRVAFRFTSLAEQPIAHGMSGRRRGDGHDGDVGHGRGTTAEIIEANRTDFLNEVSIEPASLTIGRQTHGSRVEIVDRDSRGRGRYPAFDGFPATDALVTADPSVALGVIVADCVPLVLYDPVRHAVGVVHAGWRGTVAGIAPAAVETMRDAFGSSPADLLVGIGPSIGPCCYEVGVEVADAWRASGLDPNGEAISSGGTHFDLWAANMRALASVGVAEGNVEISGGCVRCQIDRFFSYRAAARGVAMAGRMLMVAKLSERGRP